MLIYGSRDGAWKGSGGVSVCQVGVDMAGKLCYVEHIFISST